MFKYFSFICICVGITSTNTHTHTSTPKKNKMYCTNELLRILLVILHRYSKLYTKCNITSLLLVGMMVGGGGGGGDGSSLAKHYWK